MVTNKKDEEEKKKLKAQDKEDVEEKQKLKAKDDEEETEKASDEEEETEKEVDSEEEETDGKKKKKAKKAEDDEDVEEKGALGGENPDEGAASGRDANSTISPGMGRKPQHILNPQSRVAGDRNASGATMGGQSPSDVGYAGKAFNPELMKSPLFVELSKQFVDLRKSVQMRIGDVSSDLDAFEKSFNDRVTNITEKLSSIEKALKSVSAIPVHKGYNEPLTEKTKEEGDISFRRV